MSKKIKINHLIDNYINVRKEIYSSIQAGNKALSAIQNANKHSVMHDIFALLNDKEYNVIAVMFKDIVESKIANCSTSKMANYIKAANVALYMQCLGLQKIAMHDVVEQNIQTRFAIIEHEDGILLCAGGYHNGECVL